MMTQEYAELVSYILCTLQLIIIFSSILIVLDYLFYAVHLILISKYLYGENTEISDNRIGEVIEENKHTITIKWGYMENCNPITAEFNKNEFNKLYKLNKLSPTVHTRTVIDEITELSSVTFNESISLNQDYHKKLFRTKRNLLYFHSPLELLFATFDAIVHGNINIWQLYS